MKCLENPSPSSARTHTFAHLVLIAGAILAYPATTQAALPKIELETIASGQIVSPIAITHAGDGSGRLFVADQRGKIHVLTDERMVLPSPFLDISNLLVTERGGFDERGLLGIAFHPDYEVAAAAGEGKFYLYYSAPSPNAPGTTADPVEHMSVVSEFQVSSADPNLADPNSQRILMTFDQPQFNHNAGQLGFGADGFLYISTGDGGGADDNRDGHTGGDGSTRPTDALGNAQDTSKLLGKILRIDVSGSDGPTGQYGIPASNPFKLSTGSERKEIFVYGLRNPWRFSFDDGAGGSGMLFCADVGQGKFEEINIIDPAPGGDAGGNLGWRIKEGTSLFEKSTLTDPGDLIDPVAEYAHPGAGGGTLLEVGVSVTGGHVYRGSAYPALNGIYVFADWSSNFSSPDGTLLGMEDSGDGNWSISPFIVEGGNPISYFINAIGEDEDGEIYVVGKTTLAASGLDPVTSEPTGTIFRVHVAPEPVTKVIAPSKDNSIYEEGDNLSSGVGNSLFAGTTDDGNTNQYERRALLAFDIPGNLPAGSTVTGASLELQVTKVPIPLVGPGIFKLHRLSKDWGEGTSNGGGTGAVASPGDATWKYNFFDTAQWVALGGDYLSGESATADAGSSVGPFTISSAGMANDLQHWLDNPGENFGWILIGGPEPKTARKFGSLQNTTPTNRPALTVEYTPGIPTTRRQDWLAEFFSPGEFVDNLGDLDFDQIPNLVEYALALDPTVANDGSELPSSELSDGKLLFSVRRDPRATDLTYQVQISSGLDEWTVIAESVGGAEASGSGFVSETPVPGDSPLVLINVQDPAPSPQTKRFVRLRVFRTP